MGALAGLALTGMVIVGIYMFFTNSDFRRRFFADFSSAPIKATFVFLWCGCLLLFLWGIFVPSLGTIKILIMGKNYDLWGLAAIASFVGFVINILWETPRRPK